MMGGFEELQKIQKDNSEMVMESIGALSKGIQAVSNELSEYQKKSWKESSDAMSAVMGAGTLDKAFEAQNSYAKSSYENFVTEMTKLGEMYSEMAKDAYKPFSNIMPEAKK
ncbi:phasin family protein [Pseudovibrio sp. SPO723]|uniref:phasin family protein n=1 Tax=Nesiotobacter zosterae TaxID=392721 RepID=UPI0029C34391|nr:phasin family protein [Pseudovibrio sp. SPO723]MDX5594485.1 phasin family protein [Pseudovibrio sp. SPO723]